MIIACSPATDLRGDFPGKRYLSPNKTEVPRIGRKDSGAARGTTASVKDRVGGRDAVEAAVANIKKGAARQ